VKDEPEGIYIAAERRARACQLLGRHVLGRARQVARMASVSQGGEAEVCNAGVTTTVDHDVRGLQVTVDDAYGNYTSPVNKAQARALRGLLETQAIASLGTLHDGEPFVSMVPFALLPGGAGFIIHVSRLASHTKDIEESPEVSLLVIAPPDPEVSPQATPRVTIQGRAIALEESGPGHAMVKEAYLSRFPQSAMTFGLADFSLFAIRPRTVRFIGGFAQALSLTPEALAGVFS